MDVASIKPRLEQRIDDLGLTYKEISLSIGRPAGWLSDVLKGKQKTIKTADLEAMCERLGVTEDWLRGKVASGQTGGPSLYAIAPEPPARPSPVTLEHFIDQRRAEIDAELDGLRERVKELEAERRQLIEAAKVAKVKR